MNDKHGKPTMDNSEQTREFPIGKPAPSEDSAKTRQIPVQRTAANPSSAPASPATRRMPQSRTVPKSDGGGMTRQIPTTRTVPKTDDMSGTKQIPTTRTTPKTDNMAGTKQIPASRTVPKTDDMAGTKQIPASRTVPKTDDMAGTKQLPTSRTTPKTDNMAMTKPIPAAHKTPKTDDMSGTKKVPISVGDMSNEAKNPADSTAHDDSGKKKKRKSLFTDDKPEEDEGTALVSVIKAVVYIVAVLVISVSASIFIILVGNDMFAFVKSEETVEITIPEGADVNDIAQLLADNNVIKYPSIFKWKAKDDGDDGKFIAGKYTVPMNLDYDDLLAFFKEQRDEGTTWITVPEGYTTDEIIDLLVEAGIGTKEGYVEVINNYPFDYWFVDELNSTDWKAKGRFYRLDGYLFPDTYEFYNESTEKAVINKFLSRFNVIFSKKYKDAATAMGMDVDTVVTIASMIEKEAGKAADYHLVSSVFHNRLASNYFPKMESDATALYAIHHDTGERPTNVTGEHMKYDSPYNTYLYDGLPPGPIANPSASAINAAITPEESDYYFFVSHGIDTYFGRNNAEHESNKAMIAALKNQASGN